MSFWCLQCSQKTNENNSTWGTIVVKSNSFPSFVGELKISKRHFEINWPLALGFYICIHYSTTSLQLKAMNFTNFRWFGKILLLAKDHFIQTFFWWQIQRLIGSNFLVSCKQSMNRWQSYALEWALLWCLQFFCCYNFKNDKEKE